jgi:sugar phosphate isomerase/epimerase
MVGDWLIRRLSPDSNPIEIEELPKERYEEALLHAMGSEAANVHLGTGGQARKIVKDLRGRKSKWLRSAAKDMAKTLEREWEEYRKS